MELWEFATFLEGYEDVYYQRDVDIIKLSYYTGMFAQPQKKKPKSLDRYINEIKKARNKDVENDKPVDVEKSRKIMDRIQELKRGVD